MQRRLTLLEHAFPFIGLDNKNHVKNKHSDTLASFRLPRQPSKDEFAQPAKRRKLLRFHGKTAPRGFANRRQVSHRTIPLPSRDPPGETGSSEESISIPVCFPVSLVGPLPAIDPTVELQHFPVRRVLVRQLYGSGGRTFKTNASPRSTSPILDRGYGGDITSVNAEAANDEYAPDSSQEKSGARARILDLEAHVSPKSPISDFVPPPGFLAIGKAFATCLVVSGLRRTWCIRRMGRSRH